MMNKKQAFPFISWSLITVVVCLLVWVILPMQAIIQHQASRLCWQIGITLVMLASCVWVLLAWRRHNMIWKALQTDGSWPLIEPVMTDCAAAMTLLKKQYGFWRAGNLRQCPWLLLLGAPGAGKTSLLANAGLALESVGEASLKPVVPTQAVTCWVGDRVLLVDASGEWCWGEAESTAHRMWKNVLRRWQCFRSPRAHTTALLVLDSSQIQSQDKKAWRQYVGQLSRQCQTVQSIIPNVQFTVVVSKADCLLGFSAFFSLLSLEERQQLCGIALTPDKGQTVLECMTVSLCALLQRIDRLTISRLHQEQNVLRRDLLRAFPQRLGMFVDELSTLIEALPGRVQASMTGIYLTSAEQQAEPEEDATTGSALTLGDTPLVGSRPYFVRELFAHLVMREPHHRGAAVRWHWTVYHLLIGSGVIAAGVYFLHQGFVNTRSAIEEAKAVLSQSSQHVSASMPAWESRLNALQHVMAVLNKHRLMQYRWLGYSEGDTLMRSANQQYQTALKLSLLPYLSGLFEQVIRQDWDPAHIDPRLFHDLNLYEQWLSLPEEKHEERLHYVETIWDRLHWTADQKQALLPHVTALLKHMPRLLGNQHVLEEAKQVLLSLPREQVAWMVVRSQFMGADATLTQTVGNSLTVQSVNRLFLPATSTRVKEQLIPAAIELLAQSETVLGKALFLKEEATHLAVIEAVYQHYLKNLDAYWYDHLPAATLEPATTVTLLRQQWHALSDIHSPLWAWLTQLTTVLSDSKEPLLHALFWHQLHSFTETGKDQQLFARVVAKVDAVLSACTSPETTFQTTKQQIQLAPSAEPLTVVDTLASMMSTPLRHWFQGLANQSWRVLFQVSGEWINTVWQKDVYPVYTHTLQGRYPLADVSQADIKQTDFDHFFSPGGVMQRFFEGYLLPFVNVDDARWTVKQRLGVGLAISQDHVDMILRASAIQKMFYNDDHHKQLIRFSLLPETLSPHIRFVHVSVAGQQASLLPGQREAFDAQWPGEAHAPALASVQVVDQSDKTALLKQEGPWAWLRLVEAGQLRVTKVPNLYELTWSLGTHVVSMQLTADQAMNPYEPGELSSFVLWPVLIDVPKA